MVKVADYSNSNLGKIEIAPEVISVVASIICFRGRRGNWTFFRIEK